jgi:hypothetical protein
MPIQQSCLNGYISNFLTSHSLYFIHKIEEKKKKRKKEINKERNFLIFAT